MVQVILDGLGLLQMCSLLTPSFVEKVMRKSMESYESYSLGVCPRPCLCFAPVPPAWDIACKREVAATVFACGLGTNEAGDLHVKR
jgi:hypothetical protein